MQIAIWPDDWAQYELLDSGDFKRLERFGDVVVIRSEPRAWWSPQLPNATWQKAVALYEREEKGQWQFRGNVPQSFTLPFEELQVKVKFTRMSKHVGVFPEQSAQWRWLSEKFTQVKAAQPKVLNLFAYTGLSTLAAAKAGAQVTHVDGSRVAIAWARENQALSGLSAAPIRWILDDALKFVQREVRRGNRYDAIIMDPPAFGRGPKGEIWKVERSLGQLLSACQQLLSDHPLFIFMTMYSIEASSLSIRNLLEDVTKDRGGTIRNGELVLKPKNSERVIPVSLFSVWEA